MGLFAQQVRQALRQLVRAPGFSLAVVLTLAVGIGASSAMFTIVKAVLLAPVPYTDAEDRVVMIGEDNKGRRTTLALANFVDWKARARSFSSFGVQRYYEATLSTADLALPLDGAVMSSEAFASLGIHPLLGRPFLPEDDRPGAAPSVILREDLWQNAFAGDRAVLGRTVALDGVSHTVVGVMPRRFSFPRPTSQVWVSYGPVLAANPGLVNREDRRGFFAIARLAPGVSVEAARREMTGIAGQLTAEHPATNAGITIDLRSIHDDEVGSARPILLVLFGAVGFLLLVACANVVALLLARGIKRSREMAIRTALGAARRQLFTQILAETLVLAVMSGALSFLVAAWGADALLALAPDDLPLLGDLGPDWRVVVFAAGTSLLVGILVGLVPAFHAARSGMKASLEESGAVAGGRPLRAQSLVIVVQVALALILTIGAGVTIQHALRLYALAPGFDPDGLLTVRVRLAGGAYAADTKRLEVTGALLERLEAVPGVKAAALAFPGPMTGLSATGFATAPLVAGEPVALLDNSPVTPGFFATLGIPVVAGRPFAASEGPRAPRAVILSVSAARRIFGDGDALGHIGKTVKLGAGSQLVGAAFASAPEHTVVGIVGDVRARGLLRESPGQTYVPWAQRPQATVRAYLRSALPPRAVVAAVRAAIEELDPALAVGEIEPMSDVAYGSLAGERFTALLFVLFAGMALFLAAVGMYGLVAFLVAQRTREIGVRLALGARRQDIVKLVLGRVTLLVAGGLAGGLAGTLALHRVLASLLSGLTALDPVTVSLVAGLFSIVAAAACAPPVLRALRVDPSAALRE